MIDQECSNAIKCKSVSVPGVFLNIHA